MEIQSAGKRSVLPFMGRTYEEKDTFFPSSNKENSPDYIYIKDQLSFDLLYQCVYPFLITK